MIDLLYEEPPKLESTGVRTGDCGGQEQHSLLFLVEAKEAKDSFNPELKFVIDLFSYINIEEWGCNNCLENNLLN